MAISLGHRSSFFSLVHMYASTTAQVTGNQFLDCVGPTGHMLPLSSGSSDRWSPSLSAAAHSSAPTALAQCFHPCPFCGQLCGNSHWSLDDLADERLDIRTDIDQSTFAHSLTATSLGMLPGMARPWSVRPSFPNCCIYFQLRTNQRKLNMTAKSLTQDSH